MISTTCTSNHWYKSKCTLNFKCEIGTYCYLQINCLEMVFLSMTSKYSIFLYVHAIKIMFTLISTFYLISNKKQELYKSHVNITQFATNIRYHNPCQVFSIYPKINSIMYEISKYTVKKQLLHIYINFHHSTYMYCLGYKYKLRACMVKLVSLLLCW